MGILLIRELNVDGCGDFADVLVQTDQPVTPEQMKELHHELTRLNNEQECPDTDDVVEDCLLYTSPSPRDTERSRMPSSA